MAVIDAYKMKEDEINRDGKRTLRDKKRNEKISFNLLNSLLKYGICVYLCACPEKGGISAVSKEF